MAIKEVPKAEDKSGKSKEELAKAVREESEERAKKCLNKVNAALQEFNCELVASPITQYDEQGIGHTFARPFVRPK